MANYHTRRIYGAWKEGYVLDLHTISSTYIADDEDGNPLFDTKRSEIGQLLYRLKYDSDETAVEELVDAAGSFLQKWGIKPSIIVPVPPTKTYRKLQPVASLTNELGSRLKIPVAHDAIRKLKKFAELKNVNDAEERRQSLEGAFEIKVSRIKGERVLLVDDVYRSGATMNSITEELLKSGADTVHSFAFTQTRRRG